MGLWMGSWFGIGLDVLTNLIKINEQKIALLKQASEEKYGKKIKKLEDEIEEIKTEIERREKCEEIE